MDDTLEYFVWDENLLLRNQEGWESVELAYFEGKILRELDQVS